jgi:hypothetical protein
LKRQVDDNLMPDMRIQYLPLRTQGVGTGIYQVVSILFLTAQPVNSSILLTTDNQNLQHFPSGSG